MTVHPNAQRLRDVYEAVGQGNVDALVDLLTEDGTWTVSALGPFGRAYAKSEIPQAFGKMFDVYQGTLRVEVADVVADDTNGIVLTKESGSVDGEAVAWTGSHVYWFDGTRATRCVIYLSGEYQQFWAARQQADRGK